MNEHITKECLYRRKTCSFCHEEYVAAREMIGLPHLSIFSDSI